MPGDGFRLQRLTPGTVPNFADSLFGRGREWVRDALCAEPEHSDERWIIEPSRGRESASTVVKLFEICARCPVKTPCLRDALGEQSFTIEGCWGGSVRTERRAGLNAVAKQMVDPDDAFSLRWHPDRPDGSSSLGQSARYGVDHAELVELTAQVLESSFELRLRRWRALMPAKPRNSGQKPLAVKQGRREGRDAR